MHLKYYSHFKMNAIKMPPKIPSISNRIQSRYVKLLTIGLASFRGITRKSKILGLVKVSIVC